MQAPKSPPGRAPAPKVAPPVLAEEPEATANGIRLGRDKQDVAKNPSGSVEFTSKMSLPTLSGLPLLPKQYLADFLRTTDLYSKRNKRWVDVPEECQDVSHLRSAIMAIATEILIHRSGVSTHTDGSSRTIVESWNIPLAHKPFSDGLHSSPSLAVLAAGPSFGIMGKGGISYAQIATCISVVAETNKKNQEEQVFELGVFAKQILYQQPNRDYVRCLYITEETVALVHFDRAGVQVTREVRYHLHPEVLVRFIVAVSSPNEKELGFDTSISWVLKNGRKISGYINVLDANGRHTKYPMRSIEPTVAHPDIQSRGLRIWKVTDPDTGKGLIIKDTWLYECQKSETEHLLRVRGIEGIVQMVAHDVAAYPSTLDIRGRLATPREERSSANKVRHRMVLEEYGDGIAQCRDERRVLEAIRDALAGLQRLNQCGLIHRDVSPSNILLGVEGAPPGLRGVVIDLDNAHAMDDSRERNTSLGTRGYTSLNVLQCRIDYEFAARYLRDHLDDIESIFWILNRIAYGWKLPGCHIGMRQFVDFSHCDITSFELKRAFFQAKAMFDTSKVRSNFGAPTRKLLKDFFRFLKEVNQLKTEIDGIADRGRQMQARLELESKMNDHYERVLALFDKALSKLQGPRRKPLSTMKINFPLFSKR